LHGDGFGSIAGPGRPGTWDSAAKLQVRRKAEKQRKKPDNNLGTLREKRRKNGFTAFFKQPGPQAVMPDNRF
jgi:hypothetical protein